MKNLYMLIEKSGEKQCINPASKNTLSFVRFGLLAFIFLSLCTRQVQAQCGPGTQQAILNWDYLDFFTYTGYYTSANGYLPNNTWSRTQNFAFGTQRLTIAHNYADASSLGENITHTGEAGTFGNQNGAAVDADIEFIGNGTVTLTFENEVSNLRFSMYDIDRGQRVQLDARNAANVQQNVTMATFAGTVLTISNNNTPNARVDATAASALSNVSTAGNVDITVAGPVRTVTINITNTGTGGGENGEFWISDILACSAGAFPNNYYQVSRPFTGQPGYVLHAFDKSVYAVDPATGRTKLLFTDPYSVGALGSTNRWYVNSMGYDPYNRVLYYVFSLTSNPAGNRMLRKYDFNTGTISTVLADINTIGIPTTTYAGVESGAAAFYNGSLYLGTETSNGSRNTNREATIWRVDFNGSNVPYRASQVFATPSDNGSGTLAHDWSDFVISNGMLYDFDGAGSTGSAQLDVYEYNMLTGVTFNNTTPTYVPGQNGVDWQENVYQLYALATGTGSPVNPYIARYNKTLGTIGATTNLFSVPMFTPAQPSLGDAAEAYRPLMDFGDAPASYDPDPLAPAVHERLANLQLGGTPDIEWLGSNSALADGDGADEDGLGAAPPLLNYLGVLTYSININVLNNTGGNANLVAWLDYNFNGVFDPSEGVSALVPSNAASQLITLTWNNISVPNSTDVRTFIRFRLAPVGDGMTTANPTGYIANGEVEDYPVLLGVALPNSNLSFQASKNTNNLVTLNWEHESDIPVKEFRLQKSADGRNWNEISNIRGKDNSVKQKYSYTDPQPVNSVTEYYRLQMVYENGRTQYSNILSVSPQLTPQALKISPNPASNAASITMHASAQGEAKVSLIDQSGKMVWHQLYAVSKGNNTLSLQGLEQLSKGIYYVTIKTNEKTETTKLVINH